MTAALRKQSSAVVIAIDGPAGAGKSSVSRLLAKQLGFDFLDTGAMYRCVTLAALRSGVSLSDQTAVEELAKLLKIEFDEDRVHLNGQDVTLDIRTTEVATSVGMIADNLAVRRMLTQMQRDWAAGRRVVSEGRDQGTDVFPDAACKIFLVADNLERAKRRQAELAAKGICLDLDSILAQQEVRDQADRSRPVGALRKAEDAIEFSTDQRSLQQVVDELYQLVVSHLGKYPSGVSVNRDREEAS